MTNILGDQQELHLGFYGSTAWGYSRNAVPFRFLRRYLEESSVTFADVITGEEFKTGAMSTFNVFTTKQLLCERILSGTLTNTPRELISPEDITFAAWWNTRDRRWVITYDHYHNIMIRMPKPGCAWADYESVHLVAMTPFDNQLI